LQVQPQIRPQFPAQLAQEFDEPLVVDDAANLCRPPYRSRGVNDPHFTRAYA
jgi:hypothetical protein